MSNVHKRYEWSGNETIFNNEIKPALLKYFKDVLEIRFVQSNNNVLDLILSKRFVHMDNILYIVHNGKVIILRGYTLAVRLLSAEKEKLKHIINDNKVVVPKIVKKQVNVYKDAFNISLGRQLDTFVDVPSFPDMLEKTPIIRPLYTASSKQYDDEGETTQGDPYGPFWFYDRQEINLNRIEQYTKHSDIYALSDTFWVNDEFRKWVAFENDIYSWDTTNRNPLLMSLVNETATTPMSEEESLMPVSQLEAIGVVIIAPFNVGPSSQIVSFKADKTIAFKTEIDKINVTKEELLKGIKNTLLAKLNQYPLLGDGKNIPLKIPKFPNFTSFCVANKIYLNNGGKKGGFSDAKAKDILVTLRRYLLNDYLRDFVDISLKDNDKPLEPSNLTGVTDGKMPLIDFGTNKYHYKTKIRRSKQMMVEKYPQLAGNSFQYATKIEDVDGGLASKDTFITAVEEKGLDDVLSDNTTWYLGDRHDEVTDIKQWTMSDGAYRLASRYTGAQLGYIYAFLNDFFVQFCSQISVKTGIMTKKGVQNYDERIVKVHALSLLGRAPANDKNKFEMFIRVLDKIVIDVHNLLFTITTHQIWGNHDAYTTHGHGQFYKEINSSDPRFPTKDTDRGKYTALVDDDGKVWFSELLRRNVVEKGLGVTREYYQDKDVRSYYKSGFFNKLDYWNYNEARIQSIVEDNHELDFNIIIERIEKVLVQTTAYKQNTLLDKEGNLTTAEPDIVAYTCHNSCYSSCHGSRGRR